MEFTEEEFEDALQRLATEYAPALFAVAQVYGDKVDGRIAAWGMAFDDHVEVVSVDTGTTGHLGSVDGVLRWFGTAPNVTTRLIWLSGQPTGLPR